MTARDRGYLDSAAPITLPAAPVLPSVWPLPLIPCPESVDRTEPFRLVPTVDEPPAMPAAARPSRDPSRVVVGYLRAASAADNPLAVLAETTDFGALDADATAPLVAAITQYARERGLTVLRIHRDDVTDDDARRPGFSACLRHLYLREASAIVVPTWDHLAPNDVLRRALCQNATSAGGAIQVVDPNI